MENPQFLEIRSQSPIIPTLVIVVLPHLKYELLTRNTVYRVDVLSPSFQGITKILFLLTLLLSL